VNNREKRCNPRIATQHCAIVQASNSKENEASMIYARDVAEAWGWAAFRMITGFALTVFAFVTFDRQTAYLCLVLLIALDLASQGAAQSLGLQMKALQQKLWMDELTNRIFLKNW